MSQYLFPDAAVEKSSESSKNRTAQANSGGKAEQDKNSDYVSFSIYRSNTVDASR